MYPQVPVREDTIPGVGCGSAFHPGGGDVQVLLEQMIVHEQCIRFHDDMKKAEQRGKFIPLDDFEALLGD